MTDNPLDNSETINLSETPGIVINKEPDLTAKPETTEETLNKDDKIVQNLYEAAYLLSEASKRLVDINSMYSMALLSQAQIILKQIEVNDSPTPNYELNVNEDILKEVDELSKEFGEDTL